MRFYYAIFAVALRDAGCLVHGSWPKQNQQTLVLRGQQFQQAVRLAIHGVSIQTKLPANECMTLIVKNRDPRRRGLKTGVPLAANASDPQPLAAVTAQDTTEAGDVGTAAWPSVRGLGLLCPSVPVERDHRPPITTQNPNSSPKAKSANPITIGKLQGACCWALGPR